MNTKIQFEPVNNIFWVERYGQFRQRIKDWCEQNNAILLYHDTFGQYTRFAVMPVNWLDLEEQKFYSEAKRLVMMFRLAFDTEILESYR